MIWRGHSPSTCDCVLVELVGSGYATLDRLDHRQFYLVQRCAGHVEDGACNRSNDQPISVGQVASAEQPDLGVNLRSRQRRKIALGAVNPSFGRTRSTVVAAELLVKLLIRLATLEIPFSTHGVFPIIKGLGVDGFPRAASSGPAAFICLVLLHASL